MFLLLLPASAHGEGIDTEHIYGFMIGTDVGELGEREIPDRDHGAILEGRRKLSGRPGQQLELEFVPIRNFRVEVGTTLAAHNINSVPGFAGA